MKTISAKTIVHRTKNGWFGTEYTMNIYRGCCHGCIYCDSRSDCYQIKNFDSVQAKENALALIGGELYRKEKKGVIGTGAMSDPYNPLEEQYVLTGRALELIGRYGFGVGIATKSDLIVRDTELLCRIQKFAPVICKVTITAASDCLSKKIEPGAPVSSRRFAAVSQLADKGIFAGILLMPVLPYLEDTEENVLAIVKMARQAGAKFIYPAFGMTMRQGQREWFLERLDAAFPGEGLKEKYLKRYGARYQCTSPHAKSLYALFSRECQKYGILFTMQDIVRAYRTGYTTKQLTLF